MFGQNLAVDGSKYTKDNIVNVIMCSIAIYTDYTMIMRNRGRVGLLNWAKSSRRKLLRGLLNF